MKTAVKRRSGRSGTVIPRADRQGVRLELYVSEELAERIDAARGDVARATWIRERLDAATKRK